MKMSLEDYENWKAGKKVSKAPWVIKHYETVTDIEQFKTGKIVESRLALIVGIFCLILGLLIGFLVKG